jgi:hypothetical protein
LVRSYPTLTRFSGEKVTDRLATILKSLPVDNSVPPYLYLKPAREGVGRFDPNAMEAP